MSLLSPWLIAANESLLLFQSKHQLVGPEKMFEFVASIEVDVKEAGKRMASSLAFLSDYDAALSHAHQLTKTWRVLEQDRLKQTQREAKKLNDKKNKMHAVISKGASPYDGLSEDFREIPIIPSTAELLQNIDMPLVPNKVKGAYFDIDDYLGTNFFLLREDFVRDFKDGIEEFKNKKSDNKKSRLVNLYPDSVIKNLYMSRDILGLKLRINLPSKVWNGARKLMYGSLVVFTADHFEKTLFYGVVRDNNAKKNSETAAKHKFIEFCVEIVKHEEHSMDAVEIYQEYVGRSIVIIESKAFFEAYSHSLKQMQNIEDFNLADLIVDHDHLNNTMPDYLFGLEQQVSKYVQKFTFEREQEKAFRTALSTRLSLIQGPPGTGKTYIGSAIAKFLLSNNIKQRIGPIILTCYTNHALDQFLTKIMEGEPPGAIIRLGGNSKDETIQQLSLTSVAR